MASRRLPESHVPRLLFDENLSHRLVGRLASVYPASVHVRDLGLRGAGDPAVWSRAAADALMIVSKDDDFRQLAFLRGMPPKVVWLVVGNAATEAVARLLEQRLPVIEQFEAHRTEALLLLKMPARG